MTSTDKGDGSSSPGVSSLRIIALFLGLTEVVVGAAATQVTGWIQGLWAVFAVVFPMAVAASFFAILWQRPYVLYGPADYTEKTSVSVFADAMRGSISAKNDDVLTAIRAAVEAAVRELPASLPRDRGMVDRVVLEAEKSLSANSVHVDISAVSMDVTTVSIADFGELTVNELLDRVWFSLADHVPAYTYGEYWVLVDSTTRKRLTQLGTLYARLVLGLSKDSRAVADVGIHPGARLEVALLPESTIHDLSFRDLALLPAENVAVVRALFSGVPLDRLGSAVHRPDTDAQRVLDDTLTRLGVGSPAQLLGLARKRELID